MRKSMFNLSLLTGLCMSAIMQAQAWTGEKQEKPKERVALKYGPITPAHRTDEAMQKFREYGLGQFIHWGIYAIPGNEWNGVSARGGAAASEWIRSWSGPTAPKDWKNTYDNLYKQFNPKDFDAKRWAKQAKDMGAKYVIFTTKHHDGFALWPTKYSAYNITKTPYKKDIVKQIVDAYDAEGIDVFLYFSILEWNNPDYLYKEPQTAEEKAKYSKFLKYTENQLLELLKNYPQIKGFWFDGTWDASWKSAYEFTYNLEKKLREKHPGLIIGSRFRNDENQKRHFDTNGDLLGDYEQGWERKLPKNYESLNGNDWDCVMTIPPNGWGYMKDWNGIYTKTPDDLIEMLMRSRSMGGNFVINFGPDGNGNFHPEEDKIMKEIGEWTKVNAEAIYNVEHSPMSLSNYGYFTKKGNNTYLTVFNRPVNQIVRLAVDKKSTEVPSSASLLTGNRKLELKQSDMGLDLDKNTYYDIILPKDYQTDKAFVIKIEMKQGSVKTDKLMDAKM
ncbi:alpha-L-fucosidase [Elizabethkingia anophelis]|nr:alpha-L-fucosidase [Elizabethkingia anophelis]MCT3959430.1 alpha-L-fucosidase [Elizabethkingia anophelis]MCT4013429.1 alpha-L-fucosidase [Elizabethkingia anophelis]MCT4138161.1 alpha-L-fucosidase [Elizabethkingia anophelis]MCT4210403.1 alpha-L-fucosidase [Elizabethkingia anophelis]MCT4297490.1 alpha-L-fucosidase [Elizabethkingia anophelis]